MAQICEPGGKGTFVYGEPWLPDDWHPAINATIYLLLLCWAFIGVAVLADLFMSSIEEITSQHKTVLLKIDGKERIYRVAVWNATVANLTLMVRPLPASAAPALHETHTSFFLNGESGTSLWHVWVHWDLYPRAGRLRPRVASVLSRRARNR
jgi:hypothetical protein